MSTRTYPQSVSNQNVPQSVFLVAHVETMSGEISETYYIDPDGMLWKVCDWVGSKPQLAYLLELCKLTGDTEQMITARFCGWQNLYSNYVSDKVSGLLD